jgi:hypothetical protein
MLEILLARDAASVGIRDRCEMMLICVSVLARRNAIAARVSSEASNIVSMSARKC